MLALLSFCPDGNKATWAIKVSRRDDEGGEPYLGWMSSSGRSSDNIKDADSFQQQECGS